MADLTPQEKAVYELRMSEDPPPTFAVIGEKLNMHYEAARDAFRRASHKLKTPHPSRSCDNGRLEYRDPELSVEAIELVTDPLLDNLAKACRETGIPEYLAISLKQRMQRDYLPVKQALERIRTDTLVKQFENLAHDALESITPGDLTKLDAYKRTLVAAISTDKRELLDGRPTERISMEDRRKLPEIMVALMREAERRGLTSSVDPGTNVGRLIDREDANEEVRAGEARMAEIGAGS